MGGRGTGWLLASAPRSTMFLPRSDLGSKQLGRPQAAAHHSVPPGPFIIRRPPTSEACSGMLVMASCWACHATSLPSSPAGGAGPGDRPRGLPTGAMFLLCAECELWPCRRARMAGAAWEAEAARVNARAQEQRQRRILLRASHNRRSWKHPTATNAPSAPQLGSCSFVLFMILPAPRPPYDCNWSRKIGVSAELQTANEGARWLLQAWDPHWHLRAPPLLRMLFPICCARCSGHAATASPRPDALPDGLDRQRQRGGREGPPGGSVVQVVLRHHAAEGRQQCMGSKGSLVLTYMANVVRSSVAAALVRERAERCANVNR